MIDIERISKERETDIVIKLSDLRIHDIIKKLSCVVIVVLRLERLGDDAILLHIISYVLTVRRLDG